MAEVIGILSGAITFIDAGIKVANLLSSLKNAPKRIAAYHEELQGMVQLVNTIKNDLDRLSNGTGWIPQSLMSQSDLDELQCYMQEAAEVTKQVEAFLDVATASPRAGRIERSWKAVRARKLQGEITERLERMGSLRASIQLWFNRQTYLISAGQICSNGAIGRSIQALQDRLDSMEGVLRASASSTAVSISAAVQKSEHTIVAVLQNEIRTLSQPIDKGQPRHMNTAAQQVVPAMNCTCKRSASPYLSLGPIYFRNDKRHVHEQRCPLRQTSNRKVVFGLRIQLGHLQFITSFGARGFSLAPQVKLPGRIVDVSQSSTFIFVDDTLRTFDGTFTRSDDAVDSVIAVCDKLTAGLRIRFANLDGFANDQDQGGVTLLHRFIAFVTSQAHMSCHDLTTAFDAIKSVIALLIHSGADPNSVMLDSSNCLLDHRFYGTPMDLAIECRNTFGSSVHGRLSESILLEAVLKKHGCELSDYVPQEIDSYKTVLLCFHDSEFAIDLGFPSYYLPVFRKSLVEVSAMTAKGHNWNDYDKRFPSPVACSLFWLDGLKYLLDWGVDCRSALIMALEARLTSALRLLFTYNCPAFFMRPSGVNRECETSLLDPDAYSDVSFRIALPYVTHTRKLLAEYGLRVLPESWERHHLQQVTSRGVLLDQHALRIWNALETGNFHPPAYLWPGTGASVYHRLAQSYLGCENLKEIAECLWESGFRDIHGTDSQGWTPFDIAIACVHDDLCTFFLSKDLQPPRDALWMNTRCPDLPDNIIPRRWIIKLSPELDHDGCTCFCSVSGCTPASVLVRKHTLGYLARRRIIDMFARALPVGSREECHIAYMRLEIFERLGMAHTCCRAPAGDEVRIRRRYDSLWEMLPTDEIEEIQVEDRILRKILEGCMELLATLRKGFRGRFRDFLNGVRAAMSLLLPFGDSVEDGRFLGAMSASSLDEDAASSELSGWVDADMVRAIVSHYQEIYACLELYMDANIQNGLTREIHGYVPELEDMFQDFQNLGNSSLFRQGNARTGYHLLYPPDSRRKVILNGLIYDEALPLCVARVIRDLTVDENDRIPPEILDLLEREGIIREGMLTAKDSSGPEYIFGEAIGMLEL